MVAGLPFLQMIPFLIPAITLRDKNLENRGD